MLPSVLLETIVRRRMSGKLLSPFLDALFSVVTGWLCDLTFLIISERTLVVVELKAWKMTAVLDSLINIELTVRLAKLRDSMLQMRLFASLQALLRTEVDATLRDTVSAMTPLSRI
jgi:hypothetical protein